MGHATVVVEAIVMISAVIAASVFASALVTKVGELRQAVAAAIRSQVERVEIDAVATYATYDPGQSCFLVYIKNVGRYSVPYAYLPKADVYFGSTGSAQLYSYDSDGNPAPGEWSFTEALGNGNDRWEPGETIVLRIYNSTAVDPPYYVKFVLPSGSSVEAVFSEVPR